MNINHCYDWDEPSQTEPQNKRNKTAFHLLTIRRYCFYFLKYLKYRSRNHPFGSSFSAWWFPENVEIIYLTLSVNVRVLGIHRLNETKSSYFSEEPQDTQNNKHLCRNKSWIIRNLNLTWSHILAIITWTPQKEKQTPFVPLKIRSRSFSSIGIYQFQNWR